MSCHSTHGNKGAINLAAKATGQTNKVVEEAFHDLKREARTVDGRTAPAPTVDDWERHLHKQRQLAGILLDGNPTGQKVVDEYIDASYGETPPDRETFYAQQHLVAEVRRRQLAAERAANGTKGPTMDDLRANDWNREQAERMGMDPDRGGPSGLLTDEMEAAEFADPIGSGRYLSCGCKATSGCAYQYGGDCNKMLAAEYEHDYEDDESAPAAVPAAAGERVGEFMRVHADEAPGTALRAVGGDRGVMSDRHGPMLTVGDLREGNQGRIEKFLDAYRWEDGALPIAASQGEHGVMSNSGGPMLTLGDLRAHAERQAGEMQADREGVDFSWTAESMDEMASAPRADWGDEPPF